MGGKVGKMEGQTSDRHDLHKPLLPDKSTGASLNTGPPIPDEPHVDAICPAKLDATTLTDLLDQANSAQLLDLLQLDEFFQYSTYACCVDDRLLAKLLLREMDKKNVTKDQVKRHFESFEPGESILARRWKMELYNLPRLSLLDGSSCNWRSLMTTAEAALKNAAVLKDSLTAAAEGEEGLKKMATEHTDPAVTEGDTKDLDRLQHLILERLKAHDAKFPQLRLDILEVGELRDMRASEFFWRAPAAACRERVARILSKLLRGFDEEEVHARLDYFLVPDMTDAGRPSAAILRMKLQLTAGKELPRCSRIAAIQRKKIFGKSALVEQSIFIGKMLTREKCKKEIMDSLEHMTLYELRNYVRNLGLRVDLCVGGWKRRTLYHIREDIAEAVVDVGR